VSNQRSAHYCCGRTRIAFGEQSSRRPPARFHPQAYWPYFRQMPVRAQRFGHRRGRIQHHERSQSRNRIRRSSSAAPSRSARSVPCAGPTARCPTTRAPTMRTCRPCCRNSTRWQLKRAAILHRYLSQSGAPRRISIQARPRRRRSRLVVSLDSGKADTILPELDRR
jgi:hypothetical protein